MQGELDADDSHKQWLLRARFYDAGGVYIGQETAASGRPDSLTKTWQRKGDVLTTDGQSLTEKRQVTSVYHFEVGDAIE